MALTTESEDQIKMLGIVTAALAALKWLFGRSRTATVDEKYEAIKKALADHESSMNAALREIRLDIKEMRDQMSEADEAAMEQRKKVNGALDEMAASLQSFKRAVNSVLNGPETPPTRMR